MEKLIHLLIPRQSNNHKAKILHSSSLIVIAVLMIILQGIINYLPDLKPGILGYASSISKDEVVKLTNQKRLEAGLSQLTLNNSLSNAAQAKGNDMIVKDYWAHVAPDGTQPWKFFSNFGYKYKYAGENLARDFSNANDAMDAWMNSPTHKENILNPKYKEIGIGVIEGDLAGSDTTIIVQFFGATYADKITQPVAQVPEVPKVLQVETTPVPEVKAVLISPFTTTRNVSLSVVGLLLAIFIIDAFLVQKRKITRIAGRTFAHVIFLLLILAIIVLLRSGKII